MGATAEALPARAQGVRSSSLRRPLFLRSRGLRLTLEPDGSLKSLDSLVERRSVFGSEHIWVYKVQAGVLVQAARQDWSVRASPRSAQFAGRLFEGVDVLQTVDFFQGSSSGFVRRVRFRNGGTALVTLRVISVLDPTAAQSGGPPGRWGSLGVNAFNRGSHVAMDELSDPPSARVVGAIPAPKRFFMTTDRSRAQELVTVGDLPEQTAGMSGQVLIMSQQDLDLSPLETKDVTFACIYSPTKLEDTLTDFTRLQSGAKPGPRRAPAFACSSQSLTEALGWAVELLGSAQFAGDRLERLDSLGALLLTDPEAAKSIIQCTKEELRRDGSVPHSLDQGRAGYLETSVFLKGASTLLLLTRDKKATRALYPTLKKAASAMVSASKDDAIVNSPSLPQGWRRQLGRGYPTGEIPEVSLAAAAGLMAAAQVARQISKSDDGGKYRERSVMIAERVRMKLLDERGFLSLCLESSGRLRSDETIDMAVAAYRHPFLRSAEQAVAHRLLEKDFETPYGPRTVPQSNRLYFNRSYGSGQLGGYWTRAALAHAILCYRVGLSGTGSLILDRVARLVTEDSVKFGSPPGDFPQWVDVEGKESHGEDGDPVAAARLIESIFEGELGFKLEGGDASFSPPETSGLKWVLAADFWAGEPMTTFVGRGGGKAFPFVAGPRASVASGAKFQKAERLEDVPRGLQAISFYLPGQVVCVGNSTNAPVRGTVSVAPRAAELAKRLSTPIEEYDRAKGSWEKTGTLRVLPAMTFEVSVPPADWKAFRISTA